MKTKIVAACCAAVLLHTTTAGLAASLIGSQFVLLQNQPPTVDISSAAVSPDGQRGFRVDYRRLEQDFSVARVYTRLFSFNAKPKTKNTLVSTIRNSDTAWMNVYLQGSMPLSDGQALVTFSRSKEKDDFFAQRMTDNAPTGEILRIDGNKKLTRILDPLLQLYDRRGLAVWRVGSNGSVTKTARFISPDGVFSKAFNIGVPGEDLFMISPHLDAFVTSFRSFNPVTGAESYSSQVYDANGAKVGEPKSWEGEPFYSARGLMDGHLLTIGPQYSLNKTVGRVFDKDWNPLTPVRPLFPSLVGVQTVTPLPGGDFMLFWLHDRTDTGVVLEAARFSEKLKMVGPSVQLELGPDFGPPPKSMLLDNGTVLLIIFDRDTNQLRGQLIQP